MRTVLARLLVLGVLVSTPFTVSAANIDLTNWRVTASENDSYQLDLAVEYIGSSETIAIDVPAPPTDNTEQTVTPTPTQPGQLIINEFVGDPISGQNEWVELYNRTDNDIDLSDWYIIEGSGKQTELEGIVEGEGFFLISSPKGSLNNSGDLIQLYTPTGVWIDGVAYGNWNNSTAPAASDPFSVGRNRAGAFVEMEPTPGELNREPASKSEETSVEAASTDSQDEPQQDDNTTITDSPESTPTTCDAPEHAQGAEADAVSDVPFVALADIRNHPKGTELVTEGLVSVLPGILGKQYFYLAGSGVQTYLHSADFPLLERGTRVRVTGELSESGGETRLKASQTSDIQIMSQEDGPLPHDVLSSQIGESTEGWLVRLTGSVTDKNSGAFMLADTEGEVNVVLKPTTGVAMTASVGDELTVTGIVGQTSSGYRLLPRDQQDLIVRSEQEETQATGGGVLSSGSGSGTAGLALSAVALAAIVGSVGVYFVRKRLLTKPLTA